MQDWKELMFSTAMTFTMGSLCCAMLSGGRHSTSEISLMHVSCLVVVKYCSPWNSRFSRPDRR